jgi:hypothetical protein
MKKLKAKPDPDLVEAMTAAGKMCDAAFVLDENETVLAGLDYVKSLVKLGKTYGENLDNLAVPAEAFESLGANGRLVAFLGVAGSLEEVVKAKKKK